MTVGAQFLSDVLVVSLGWFLLHVLWQGTLVALGLAVLLALIDTRSATIRHGLSTFALVLMLVLPLLTAFGEVSSAPGLPVPGLVASVDLGVVASASHADARPVSSLLARAIDAWAAWIPWFVPAWLCGVSVLTIRTLLGWWVAHQLSRAGLAEVPELVYSRFVELKRRLGVTAEVIVRQSRLADVPAVVGYFRPVLLLPVSAVSGMTLHQLETLIAHELAHIRRHDYLVNVFQQVAEILLFFHPAVWWVSSQLRREREHCCDDLAVLVCGDVVTYASALLTLEEQRPTAAPRLVLAATHGRLIDRVHRLLGRSEWQPGSRTVTVPIALAAVCLSLAVVSAQPTAPSTSRDITSLPTQQLISLFDETTDRTLRQALIGRLSGDLSPVVWNKLLDVAESDPDLEVRRTAISYIAGRPSVKTLSTLYDKADRRDIKLYLLSYIHGMYNQAAFTKIRSIATTDTDVVVRTKALDYLSGQ